MLRHLIILSAALPSLLLGDQIILKSGEKVQGQLLDMHAGFVTLQISDTGGEAIRRFHPNQIKQLKFEDQKSPLDLRANRRARFIQILPLVETQLLFAYLDDLQDKQQHRRALNLTKLWHAQNPHPDLDPRFRKFLIKCSLASGHPNEALEHARSWLKQTPTPYEHPLPWQIIARNQLDQNKAKLALKTALTPIAYATHETRAQLEELHSIASQAYHSLGYTEHAAAHLSQDPLALLEIETPLHISP